MGSVAALLHPERWLSAWLAIGGTITLGDPMLIAGRECDGLLYLGPSFVPAETYDSPRRREYKRLRTQIEQPAARAAVVDYLERRAATRGGLG